MRVLRQVVDTTCTIAVVVLVASLTAIAQPSRSDTIVRTVDAPRYAGVATLVEEASVGVRSGAPEYEFSVVRDILSARDGTVWVLDGGAPLQPGARRVRQYDAQGRYLRTVGRQGQGPGEFGDPWNLGQLHDGRVLVYEPMPRRRITAYSERGEPDTAWTLAPRVGTAMFTSRLLRVGPSGLIYESISIYRRPSPGAPATGRDEAIVRLTPAGEIIDTVFAPTDIPSPVASVSVVGGGIPYRAFPTPYTAYPRSAWSPLGYWVTGVPTTYAFELRTRSPSPAPAPGWDAPPIWAPGDPVMSIRRPGLPSVSIQNEERADRMSHLEAQIRSARGTPSGPPPEVPRIKPAYHGFMVGDDGRIWVQVPMPSERDDAAGGGGGGSLPSPPLWREPQAYDVFEPDGSLVGRVAVPDAVTLYTMRGEIVWGTVRDADDVVVVKRFRIQWRGRQ